MLPAFSFLLDILNAMSIERHSRARQIELGQSLEGRRKIYLDMRFWIIARDTGLGVRTERAARKLLHYLRRGVARELALHGHEMWPMHRD